MVWTAVCVKRDRTQRQVPEQGKNKAFPGCCVFTWVAVSSVPMIKKLFMSKPFLSLFFLPSLIWPVPSSICFLLIHTFLIFKTLRNISVHFITHFFLRQFFSSLYPSYTVYNTPFLHWNLSPYNRAFVFPLSISTRTNNSLYRHKLILLAIHIFFIASNVCRPLPTLIFISSYNPPSN